jgi:hypothetical protein
MEKQEVYAEVVKKCNEFCKAAFEEFDVQVEGSCEETYKYMSRANVTTVLQMCFDETFKLCNKEQNAENIHST